MTDREERPSERAMRLATAQLAAERDGEEAARCIVAAAEEAARCIVAAAPAFEPIYTAEDAARWARARKLAFDLTGSEILKLSTESLDGGRSKLEAMERACLCGMITAAVAAQAQEVADYVEKHS